MLSNYEKFLILLKQWPLNPQRTTRDFGIKLREFVKRCSDTGNPFPGTTEENSKKLESLQRITDNHYGKMYIHNITTGASGLPLKDLKVALDDDFIKEFNKKKFKYV